MARRSDHTREELVELALESARAIVVEKGIAGLSGRKVTARMGYTIGTLYQIFGGMDDLVETMNARTLALLYDECAPKSEPRPDTGSVADRLRTFGFSFVKFVNDHPDEWDAIMSYRYGDGHIFSQDYSRQIDRLFGLMKDATQHLYSKDEEADHMADMAVLWASLMGILGVAASEREVGGLSLEQMLDRLIRLYVKARG